ARDLGAGVAPGLSGGGGDAEPADPLLSGDRRQRHPPRRRRGDVGRDRSARPDAPRPPGRRPLPPADQAPPLARGPARRDAARPLRLAPSDFLTVGSPRPLRGASPPAKSAGGEGAAGRARLS